MNFNSRTAILLLVAVGVAGITAFMARSWLSANQEAATPIQQVVRESNTRVLVAAQPMPAGVIVQPDHLTWQSWPDDRLQEVYVVKESGQETPPFIGAVVRHGIAVGEPVTAGRVVKPEQRGFMAAVLTPGMRAVSVPISATTGIAGFVFPGDRVDLVLTHDLPGKRRASETVLANVRILAVDQLTNDQIGQPKLAKTATLEVTPKQVEKIAVARKLGTLSLSLRSLVKIDQDSDEIPVEPAMPTAGQTYTWDNEVSHLLGRASGPQSTQTVNVARGGKVTGYKFKRESK